MPVVTEFDTVRAVAIEYLGGMIRGQHNRIEKAFHPRAIQAGHFGQTFEFFSRQGLMSWLRSEKTEPVGSDFVDCLVMVKHEGVSQIVTKPYHVPSGTGKP